jgi:hypothetical protein
MKVQSHSSIARAKRIHQVLTHLTDKSTISTRMGADHRKIRRKNSGLCSRKLRIGHMSLERIATKPKAATQIEAATGAEFKTSPSIACSMKETLTTGQEIAPSSWNPKRK